MALLASAFPASSDALVKPGAVVQDMTLPALGGGAQRLFSDAKVHILVFFRPGERSRETLTELAACERDLRERSVRIVGLVSSSVPLEEASTFVRETQLQIPVLVDEGDALYAALEVMQHPALVMTDGARRVFAVQPYMKLRFCDLVRARVRHQLGEIDDVRLQAELDPGRMPLPSDDRVAVARRHAMLGRRQLEKGNCAGALKSFEAALAADPTNANALEGKRRCEQP